MDRMCEGLNVVEVGAGSAAASIAGVVLADAGARVVKVEPPEGDGLRIFSSPGPVEGSISLAVTTFLGLPARSTSSSR